VTEDVQDTSGTILDESEGIAGVVGGIPTGDIPSTAEPQQLSVHTEGSFNNLVAADKGNGSLRLPVQDPAAQQNELSPGAAVVQQNASGRTPSMLSPSSSVLGTHIDQGGNLSVHDRSYDSSSELDD
jgi:hypothetical protein